MLGNRSVHAIIVALTVSFGVGLVVLMNEKSPAPQIPGITTPDETPGGCVDCHKPFPDLGRDTRLSISILKWAKEGAPEEIMTVAAAVWPHVKLTGQHPLGGPMFAWQSCISCHPGRTPEQPSSCLFCHDHNSERPLDRIVHVIHYITSPRVTGERADFLTVYGGFCTHCHSLTLETGRTALKKGFEELPQP